MGDESDRKRRKLRACMPFAHASPSDMLFNWSMEDMLRKFLKNEELIEAQIGQVEREAQREQQIDRQPDKRRVSKHD